MENPMLLGVDIGSTTAKIIIMDSGSSVRYKDYGKHNALVVKTIVGMLEGAKGALGDREVRVSLTGSAGLGVAERYGLPFVQEVVASIEMVKRMHPEARTIIDVGGEDTKMVFLDERFRPDMRMNGNCAGGTGAFLEQMATLLGIEVKDLEGLVARAGRKHPMASRCGVFAKTDVQSLLSRKVPREEIAASVYHSVAVQTVSTLSRGFEPRPKVLFCGGPLSFLPLLRGYYLEVLGIGEEDACIPRDPHLVPAMGAAIMSEHQGWTGRLSALLSLLASDRSRKAEPGLNLEPLFKDRAQFSSWSAARMTPTEKASSIREAEGNVCFLGLDSGSTTSKSVLIDGNGKVLFSHYANNRGDPVRAMREGLEGLRVLAAEAGVTIDIRRTAVTGYGEDLIRAAFGIDLGAVETLSHFRASSEFLPDVTFILDIGGQDMKAMKVRNGVIEDIVINEACSSGCGSFLETFSRSLGLGIEEFADAACRSRTPCDLGTRCTVFMNSKVKQALRDGASLEDISAGLAYSVAKNCLYKVLKVKDTGTLGGRVVVQGGTFRNPAVQRAFELLLEGKVVCPDMPELMGAFGAALLARDEHANMQEEASTFIGLKGLDRSEPRERRELTCKGCDNRCTVTKLSFGEGRDFFTGNRCERYFHNKGAQHVRGENLVQRKRSLLFDRDMRAKGRRLLRMGVPRVLSFYDDFPFWNELLTRCGIEVVLSPPSTQEVQELGSKNVMSENICFPAKLVPGHIKLLAGMGVDRIFMPVIAFDEMESPDALNSYMCPVVTGYPDVTRSSVCPEKALGVVMDTPAFSFKDTGLLRRACQRYLAGLGVKRKEFAAAFKAALNAQASYMRSLEDAAKEVLKRADEDGSVVILLAGRPYQADPLVNRGIDEMASNLGAHVITEDSIPFQPDALSGLQVLTQWAYPNRIYNAAKWASGRDNVEFVQLNSFGCGPDALVCDETRSILHSMGKHHTLVRIDEVSSQASIRLRLRSMLQSMEMKGGGRRMAPLVRKTTPPFTHADTHRKILVPFISKFYSPFIESALRSRGFDVKTLPEPDRASVEAGLKHCNNEICYPAIIVIGDVIKSLENGMYDPDRVAFGITQTGGPCRATSYLALMKKALVSSGFGNVPVVTMNLGGKDINYQPGLKYSWLRLGLQSGQGILFGDSLSQMHYSTAPRELEKGASLELTDSYLKRGAKLVGENRERDLIGLLREAVSEFNSIPIREGPVPTIGMVGEIYIKYNPFGSYNIADWMAGQGVEVVIPPIYDFFCQDFLNHRFHVKHLTKRPNWRSMATYPEEWVLKHFLRRFEEVRKDFRFYRKAHDMEHIAGLAAESINMLDQFGEGWLIAAEMSAFSEERINNVVCVQPFGCISNHIVGKGIEKAVKSKYPDLNILFLDTDPGSSEVNLYNRLNFMLKAAREDLAVFGP